jgi:cobalt-zinc-cadmium efflux system membrane fusion protein
MKKLLILTGLAATLHLIISCKEEKSTGQQNVEQAEESGHDVHENPSTTSMTSEQIRSIGIAIGSIEEKELTAALKANGTLKVPNQNRATVNTLYSGVIQTLLVQPGDKVTRGQLIATLANPDFMRSQEEYIATNDRIALAELEYNRQKELSAGNAGALKNFQAATTELKTLIRRCLVTES